MSEKQRRRPWRDLAVASGLMLLALLLSLWNPPWLRHLESTVLDWHFQLRGPIQPAMQPVTLVMVDDASLARIGRWPWPRATIAELIEALDRRYQARVIATDIVFSEPEDSGAEAFRGWLQRLELSLPADWQRHLPLEDGDRRLEDAMRGARSRIVQGFYFYSSPDTIGSSRSLLERVASSELDQVLDRAGGKLRLIRGWGVNANIPQLARATPDAGFLNFFPDVDGALRFSPLLAEVDGDGVQVFLPSLSLASVRAWLGRPPVRAVLNADGIELLVGGHRLELTAQGMAWINYYGPAGSIPTLSAADVLSGSADASLLRDRLVLLGVSAAGTEDIRATPLDPVMPGSEIQAQLIDNLLNDDFLKRPDALYLVELALILIVGLLYGPLFGRFVERTKGALTPVFLLLVFIAAHLLFREGIWMHIVVLELQLALTMMTLFALHYGAELVHRRRLKHAFASFVDPAVVDDVLEHEEEIGLTGVEREISVMFVDVAGFTALSERLHPQEVVRHINRFFDAAAPIVFRHGGCIDRLTGDGLIALFGAPIAAEDHALRACRAALELEEALDPVRPAFEALDHPLHVRVGINSGRMVVGNMGSTQRLQYTFMGDAGNTAARLESLNKQYGTTRMIGEATHALVRDRMCCRLLDRVILVGKKEAVAVYELLGTIEEKDRWQPLIEAYGHAMRLYVKGDFEAAAQAFDSAFREFHDAPSQRMWQRCMALKLRGTPADWQGVWKAESK